MKDEGVGLTDIETGVSISKILIKLERLKNTFDALGFIAIDHNLEVLYVVEAKQAVNCCIKDIKGTIMKRTCDIQGCQNEGVESFGDIEQKKMYCAQHAGMIEQMAEANNENNP